VSTPAGPPQPERNPRPRQGQPQHRPPPNRHQGAVPPQGRGAQANRPQNQPSNRPPQNNARPPAANQPAANQQARPPQNRPAGPPPQGPQQAPKNKNAPRAAYRTGPLPADMPIFDPTQPSFWQRIKYPLRWLMIAGGLIAVLTLFKRYELGSYFNPDQVQAWLAPFGVWAPAVFIGIFVVAMLLMVIPYSLMCGIGALFFGLAWGTLWSVLGATLGAIAVYSFSKLLGQGIIRKQAGNPRWENLNQRLDKDGFYYLLLVRGLAILPFNLLNFACAFTAIKMRHFIFANLIGLIPSAFVYGYGTQLLLDPTVSKTQLALLIGIVLLVVVPPIVFRQARRSRRKEQKKRIQKAFID
jgi:uncharacterized membrane protein YdjX (TVP38/TMEM64 family)